jgi:hypothetical protein
MTLGREGTYVISVRGMKMRTRVVALAAFAVLSMASMRAEAAAVGFLGTITGGGGGNAILGSIPPSQRLDYFLSLDYTETGNFFAPITGGEFIITNPTTGIPSTFDVTGRRIVLSQNAVAGRDVAAFAVDLESGGNKGTLSFTYEGQLPQGLAVNEKNILAMVLGRTTSFVLDFGDMNGGVYTGNITGIPEPGSMAALLGLVAGGAYRLRRKRSEKQTS